MHYFNIFGSELLCLVFFSSHSSFVLCVFGLDVIWLYLEVSWLSGSKQVRPLSPLFPYSR